MLERLYAKYGKKRSNIALVVLVLVFFTIAYVIFFGQTNETPKKEDTLQQVEVKNVRDIVFKNSFSTLGLVRAVSEAQLQTETGGRITSVNAELGQRVQAGAILATIENSSERAVLLQAEGAYESALAQAHASEVGVGGSKSLLESSKALGLNTYQNAYIGVDELLHTSLDTYFTMSRDKATGFRLDAIGQANKINEERTALESMFAQWTLQKNSVSTDLIVQNLNRAHTDTLRLATFIEKLSVIAQDQNVSSTFTQAQKDVVVADFFKARVSVNAILKEIETASISIDNAQKTLEQSQINGGGSAASAASAQVKIALGSLRAAQANYEKTLVRTPISGVVNALYLKTGTYVSPSQKAAIVANNNGLEVSSSVNIEDSTSLAVGDEVRIGETATGTITAIAGAIDPNTSKVAIKVSVDEKSGLSNGSTVTLTFTQKQADVTPDIIIPLSALKMTGSGPVAFSVSSENKLVSVPLTLGTITGDSVEVTEGLTFDTVIVTDARGLKDGQNVIITKN